VTGVGRHFGAHPGAIPGRAEREPGIHSPGANEGHGLSAKVLKTGLWIPGSALRAAPE